MHICYIDESGTPSISDNTRHYVLAGLSVPEEYWKSHNEQVEAIKRRYRLSQAEIHVADMVRPYVEQDKIPGFSLMTPAKRRSQVQNTRKAELLRLQQSNEEEERKRRKSTARIYRKTESYIHLTFDERHQAVRDLARLVGGWGVARLFADCIDKVHFDPALAGKCVDEEAFEQVVSRFERYLQNTNAGHGLLVHDNNQTVETRHTGMMKRFLQSGTIWTDLEYIIEVPFFVDSELTNMVQLADLCAYAIRRYVDNDEEDLFDLVFQRADKVGTTAVGVRHFTEPGCPCKICVAHNPV